MGRTMRLIAIGAALFVGAGVLPNATATSVTLFELSDVYHQPGGDYYTIIADVSPPDPGSTAQASLYKRKNGSWVKVDTHALTHALGVDGVGRFRSDVDFRVVKDAARCKVVVKYSGILGGSASDSRQFSCRWDGFKSATTDEVPMGKVELCAALTELSGLKCLDAARLFGTGVSLVSGGTDAVQRIGDPVDPPTALGQLPPLDDPVSDVGGQGFSLLVPSGMTNVTDPLNDEGSVDTVAPINTTLGGGGGGGGTGANRTGAKYVGDAFCVNRTPQGDVDGVSILLKPSSKLSDDYGFRIIEKKTQAVPKNGYEMYWVAHRTLDISDAPLGRVVRWDADAIRDYGSAFSWSLGVAWSNFSSSMSWNVPAGRSGGYKVDSNEHFAMLRVGSGTTYPESTKSEVMFRYVKPHSRKSYYLPCGAYFQKD